MHRPDGMGADRYRERQNMREARQAQPQPKFDIIAVDENGEELFVAESTYTEGEAEEAKAQCNNVRQRHDVWYVIKER